MEDKDKSISSQVCNYSWSGQRKTPSYLHKLVFPADFLNALRTLAMKEDELYRVSSLLEEVRSIFSNISWSLIFFFFEMEKNG